jgi:hypothetical protein
MTHNRRSANARLARKIFVGLFISRNPRTAHRIIVFPETPSKSVKLKKKRKCCFKTLAKDKGNVSSPVNYQRRNEFFPIINTPSFIGIPGVFAHVVKSETGNLK